MSRNSDDLRTRRIKAFLQRWGLGRYADDAAQENLVLRSQGKSANQSAKQAAIDALIALGVFTRGSQRRHNGIYSLDVAEHADALEAQALARQDDCGSGVDEGHLLSLRAAVRALKPKPRRAIELTLEGKTRKQVGLVMGVTESRVSQLVGQAILRMRTLMGIQMEKRTCKGPGCENAWDCAVRSVSIYCSDYCRQKATGEKAPLRRVKMQEKNEEISQAASAKHGRVYVTAQELAEKARVNVSNVYYHAKKGNIRSKEGEGATVYDLEQGLMALSTARVRKVKETVAVRVKRVRAEVEIEPTPGEALGAIPTTGFLLAKEIVAIARKLPPGRIHTQLLRVAVEAAGLVE
jgi:DNA-binding CsgD family transcriptional regulator